MRCDLRGHKLCLASSASVLGAGALALHLLLGAGVGA